MKCGLNLDGTKLDSKKFPTKTEWSTIVSREFGYSIVLKEILDFA